MQFISEVPNILVNNCFEITTVQYFCENESTITIRFAEHIPQFSRGYVCDMDFSFLLKDETGKETNDRYVSHAKDLVLVYVNKDVDTSSVPSFEYIFYK